MDRGGRTARQIEREQRWTLVAVIVLGVLGLWVLARNLGTGDTEAAHARAQFRAFAEAMADGDGDTACAMMIDGAAQAFAEQAALDLSVEARTCPNVVAALAAERTEDASAALRGVEIVEIRMHGADEATGTPAEQAEIDIDEGTVVLEREMGCAGSPVCWIIAEGAPVFGMADPGWEG